MIQYDVNKLAFPVSRITPKDLISLLGIFFRVLLVLKVDLGLLDGFGCLDGVSYLKADKQFKWSELLKSNNFL